MLTKKQFCAFRDMVDGCGKDSQWKRYDRECQGGQVTWRCWSSEVLVISVVILPDC